MEVNPIKFINPDVPVYVQFLENDERKYFRGIVKKVNELTEDYVNCHVIYEDGEEVKDQYLYNDCFDNEESDNPWKFDCNTSILLKYMIENNNEINELKETISAFELVDEVDEDDEDDEDDEEEEDEEEEEEEEEKLRQSKSIYDSNVLLYTSVAVNISITVFLSLLSLKFARDLGFY
jgi:hypothetical protein